MANQTTISKEVTVSGVGLHTGNKNIVTFKPAPCADYGIRFIRTDLDEKCEIQAVWSNAVAGLAIRGSVIEKDGVRIHTIEHIMSACCALGVDNLIIEINNNEPPILDGSSKIFAEAILSGEIKELDAPKEYYTIEEPVFFELGKTRISAYPLDHLEIECTIGFDHPLLKFQQITIKNLNKDYYLNYIAPAKTFCFDHEIEALQKSGLALGGSMDNAIVIGSDDIHNKEPLRYNDEFVRHKALDLIGDLYLAGRPIKAKIVADKPGHQNNIGFLKEFLKKAVIQKDEVINKYPDNNMQAVQKERILNHEEILKYIPHRYPFLMIDKVKINTKDLKTAIGYKCVSGNENFFQGHFPQAPIMPGVLIVEAMAQTSCVMFLSRPKMQGHLAYFMSIDKAKFRKPVKPGDVLELHVEIIKDGGTRGKVKGKAYVDGKLTTEAEFIFILVGRQQESAI
jgi:UDP-3-O-[3-hydroxymyristoyl] N-acetylglucosamine deacetylase/3-hydroxyacyl-[acyl-carrier-protein] dehydratase